MSTTINNQVSNAKKNIFSNFATRIVGLITAFFGLLFIIEKKPLQTILSDVTTIFSVALILFGTLLFISNIKLVFNKTSDKNTAYYLLVGVSLIVSAILLLVFKSQACKWFSIVFAGLLSIYAIIRLIKHLTSKKRGVLRIIDIVLSILLFAIGLMIVLMGFIQVVTIYLVILGITSSVVGVSDIVLH